MDIRQWIADAMREYSDEPPPKHDVACDGSCLAGPDEPPFTLNLEKLKETVRRMKVMNWVRWAPLVVLLAIACAPARAIEPVAVAPTEDPQVGVLRMERDDLAQQLQLTQAKLDKATTTPTFMMWNVPQTIQRGQMISLGLPDTFTVRIRFTAAVPVRARIMNLDQYARYHSGGAAEAEVSYPPSTIVDEIFHGAEGCASYVLVIDAEQAATISPATTITRGPLGPPTGFCAK